ncbi:MAG TPA: class I SAM-dependent methyltransferase [Longimicrobiales bacterium]
MQTKAFLSAATVALRNLVLGGNLASLPLIRRPRAAVAYASESLFALRGFRPPRDVVPRHVAEAFGASGPVSVTVLEPYMGAWAPPMPSYTVDLVSLATLCRLLEPRTIFEIGTSIGHTAAHLALNAPADAKVYTLDLPNDVEPKLETTVVDAQHARASRTIERFVFQGTEAEPKIERLHGDSAVFDFSPWHGRVDLFFIDGAHSYAYVASDTRAALACVRPGGVIAWHDYGRAGVNGVTRLLRELAREGRQVFAVPGGSLAYMLV